MSLIKKGNVAMEMQTKKISSISQLVAEASEEDAKINLLIREKYSMSQELALHRKKLLGTADDTEWQEYNDFVEDCIKRAREEELAN